MLNKTISTALLIGMVGAVPTTSAVAEGGPPCGPRKALTKKLEQAYGETRQGVGLTGGQALFEVWASETGTWTLLLTRPDGRSCVMAVGENWQDVAEQHARAGDPA